MSRPSSTQSRTTRLINIPVPEYYIEDLSMALKEVKLPCPKHRGRSPGCKKRLVAVDECQYTLLQMLSRMGFGKITIEFEDGRPTLMHAQQSFKFGNDGLEKIDWLAEEESLASSKIISFEPGEQRRG